MTSVVGILNKRGLAIAADSAVIMSNNLNFVHYDKITELACTAGTGA